MSKMSITRFIGPRIWRYNRYEHSQSRQQSIYFNFCSEKIVSLLQSCGMTLFGEDTKSDHRGILIEIHGDVIFKNIIEDIPSPY